MKIKTKNPWVILVVVFLLLVLLHFINVLQPVERLFFKAIKPISSDLYSWGSNISASHEEKQEREGLVIEIEKLKKELASFVIDKANYQEIEAENKKLKDQLEFVSNHDFNTVLANVVAKEGIFSSSERRDLIIDRGSNSGLRPELAVLSEDGIVVGKIVEVLADSSRICLTTNSGCQLAVSLQNKNQTQGLSDGRLGLTIEMNYIPQLEKIDKGDIVVTSGLSAEIPRGLIIGTVTDVRSESNEVWQSAVIEPILNFNNLTLVSVVIP